MDEETGWDRTKGSVCLYCTRESKPCLLSTPVDQTKHICAQCAHHRLSACHPDLDGWVLIHEDTWLDGNGYVTISAVYYNQDQVVTF